MSRTSFSARLTATLLATVLTFGAAGAAEWDGGKLKPLADGFPARPIVLLVVDEPGSPDSIYASQLAEAATALSPVPVVVEHRVDFTNFGTWEAIAWVNDQDGLGPEGYINLVNTLPGGVIDLLAVDIESATGVGFDDYNPILTSEHTPFILHQRADAPWGKTLDEFVAYAKEHPDTLRHVTGGPGGGQDAALRVWAKTLGFTVKDIIGGSTGERALAVAAGEGDFTVSPFDVFSTHYEAGRVVPLAGSGSDPLPEPFSDLPVAESFGVTNDPFGVIRGVATGSDVSEEHRDWLFALLSKAAESPDFIEKRGRVPGTSQALLDHEGVVTLARSAHDQVLPIFQELGIYWADKK